MTNSREKLGLLLGFIGMCLFAGTLPATRLAVSGLDPLFLTAARAALAGSAGLIVLLLDLHAGALFDVSHDAVAMASACTIRPVCRRRAAVARADMITFRYLVAFRKHIDKRAGQR